MLDDVGEVDDVEGVVVEGERFLDVGGQEGAVGVAGHRRRERVRVGQPLGGELDAGVLHVLVQAEARVRHEDVIAVRAPEVEHPPWPGALGEPVGDETEDGGVAVVGVPLT